LAVSGGWTFLSSCRILSGMLQSALWYGLAALCPAGGALMLFGPR